MMMRRYSSFLGVFFILVFSNNLIILNEHPDENDLFTSSNGDSWSRILLDVSDYESIPMWKQPLEIRYPNLHAINDSIIIAGYYIDDDCTGIVIKYHANGTKLWEFQDDSYGYLGGSVVDQDNNLNLIIEASHDYFNFYFLKINEDGELIVSRHIQELSDCMVYCVSLDSDNFNYVMGYYRLNGTRFLMKLDGTGNFVYSISFDDRKVSNVDIDDHGNVFVFPRDPHEDGPLYKFDSNGTLSWKIDLSFYLKSDDEGNAIALCKKNYIFNSTTFLHLVKLNSSSGDILNETKIFSGDSSVINQMLERMNFHCSNNNSYLFFPYAFGLFENNNFMLKHDDGCSLQWNKSIEEHAHPFLPCIISDSDENVYLIYFDQEELDVALLKVNDDGELVSRVYWGGDYNERYFEACCDSQQNVYLVVTCQYYDLWGKRLDISVLVKNPLNGGFPPPLEPGSGIYFVLTTLGVSGAISIIICMVIMRKKPRPPISSEGQIQ